MLQNMMKFCILLACAQCETNKSLDGNDFYCNVDVAYVDAVTNIATSPKFCKTVDTTYITNCSGNELINANSVCGTSVECVVCAKTHSGCKISADTVVGTKICAGNELINENGACGSGVDCVVYAKTYPACKISDATVASTKICVANEFINAVVKDRTNVCKTLRLFDRLVVRMTLVIPSTGPSRTPSVFPSSSSSLDGESTLGEFVNKALGVLRGGPCGGRTLEVRDEDLVGTTLEVYGPVVGMTPGDDLENTLEVRDEPYVGRMIGIHDEDLVGSTLGVCDEVEVLRKTPGLFGRQVVGMTLVIPRTGSSRTPSIFPSSSPCWDGDDLESTLRVRDEPYVVRMLGVRNEDLVGSTLGVCDGVDGSQLGVCDVALGKTLELFDGPVVRINDLESTLEIHYEPYVGRMLGGSDGDLVGSKLGVRDGVDGSQLGVCDVVLGKTLAVFNGDIFGTTIGFCDRIEVDITVGIYGIWVSVIDGTSVDGIIGMSKCTTTVGANQKRYGRRFLILGAVLGAILFFLRYMFVLESVTVPDDFHGLHVL